MTKFDLNKDEEKLLRVFRAIQKFNIPGLISVKDCSAALQAIGEVAEWDKLEEEYSEKEMSAYLLGFVSGLGSTRVEELLEAAYASQAYQQELEEAQQDETFFVGGPTGGVAVGQGEDPRYVTQTGPKKEQEVKAETSE